MLYLHNPPAQPQAANRGTVAGKSQQEAGKWLQEMRDWLMVLLLSVLVTSVTNQTGLNPAGVLWQMHGEDGDGPSCEKKSTAIGYNLDSITGVSKW